MANSYVQELIQRIDNRYSVDTSDMSLGDWICANTTLRGRPFSFDRYPFQKAIADDMHPNMDVVKPSQIGLALALDTPVPTPSGWTTMGEVSVGDLVYNEQGEPVPVTYVSPVFHGHPCYEIEFDTGEVLTADADHRWYVEGHLAFNEEGLYNKSGRPPVGTSRSGVIKTSLLAKIHHRGSRNLFAIPNTLPLEAPDLSLPVDPYFLGMWLGDGNSAHPTLTSHNDDSASLIELLEARGMTVRQTTQSGDVQQFAVCLPRNKDLCRRGHSKAIVGTVGKWNACAECSRETPPGAKRVPAPVYDTMYGRLTSLGLISSGKFIPPQYLRASGHQRMELLRGLLDTDGSITKLGRVSFHNTSLDLVQAVEELASSLGFKTHTRWRAPGTTTLKNGHRIESKKAIAEVSFIAYAENPVFNLARKRERLKPIAEGRPQETFRRRIVRVDQVASVPTRCISVESPRHLFLVGRGMVPTHNTEVQLRKALGFVTRNRGVSLIFTFPNDPMFERFATTRALPLVKEERVFNLESADKPSRSKGLIQIGNSFMYMTGAKEGDATSIPADVVFNDEVDLTDQTMLALFNSRLQNSDWKINQRFSTPTFMGVGVDAGYNSSDQHEYLLKCDACNHWQAPQFNEDFVYLPGLSADLHLVDITQEIYDSGTIQPQNAYLMCQKCQAPLDLSRRENREWVPKFASRTHHRGYRVSPFSTDRLSPEYVIQQMLIYKKNDFLRGWYNTVLGVAHTEAHARLSDSDIAACFTPQFEVPRPDARKPTWIGIDMGLVCHVTIGQGTNLENLNVIQFKAIPVEALLSFVQDTLDTYNVIGGAVDRHPYTPTANALFDLSRGKILPIEYRGERELNFVKELGTERVLYGQANRTIFLDLIAKTIRNHRISFSGYGHQRPTIIEMLKDNIREETPEKPAVWIKTSGNDHYFHSLGFLLTGVKIREVLYQIYDDHRSTVSIKPVTTGDFATTLNRFQMG